MGHSDTPAVITRGWRGDENECGSLTCGAVGLGDETPSDTTPLHGSIDGEIWMDPAVASPSNRTRNEPQTPRTLERLSFPMGQRRRSVVGRL